MGMPPGGRERRRTDLYGRVRRFLYGLLLLAASRGAMAADEFAALGKYRASPPAASALQQAAIATLQGLVVLSAQQASDPGDASPYDTYPGLALDAVTARIQEPQAEQSPLFRINGIDSTSIKDGIGFDLAVADFGHFHLNLYSRSNARTEGLRESMALGDPAGTAAPKSGWSLGGTLELVRTVGGERYVAMVPELRMEFGGGKARYLPFEASLKYANWRSLQDRRSLDEQVPQLAFKWRI